MSGVGCLSLETPTLAIPSYANWLISVDMFNAQFSPCRSLCCIHDKPYAGPLICDTRDFLMRFRVLSWCVHLVVYSFRSPAKGCTELESRLSSEYALIIQA